MNLFKKPPPATEPESIPAPAESNPFLASLDSLTPDDIAPKPEKKKLSSSELISEIIRRGIIAVCAVVFVWSAGKLAQSFIDEKRCGMLGLSYGGFYTLYTMAYETRIKSGWSAAFFNDRTKYCWQDFVWKDSAGRFLDAEVAGLCAPRRLWCDVGATDTVFSADGVDELFPRVKAFYEASGAPSEVRMNLWEGGHRFSDSDEHESGAMDFFLEGIGAFV